MGGSIKTNIPSSVNISLCHACDPFLGKVERDLCVWRTGKLQKWLSVSGTVAREKAMAYR